MIKGYDVEEYRKIKAPVELKQRVLSATEFSSARRQYFNYKTISAVAACVLVFIVCLGFFGGSDSPVTIGVDTVAVANFSQRMANSVTLVIESEGKIDFSTDDEGFYLYDEDKNGYTPLKSIKGVKNKLVVQWSLSEGGASVTVNNKVYSITADEDLSVRVDQVKK